MTGQGVDPSSPALWDSTRHGVSDVFLAAARQITHHSTASPIIPAIESAHARRQSRVHDFLPVRLGILASDRIMGSDSPLGARVTRTVAPRTFATRRNMLREWPS